MTSSGWSEVALGDVADVSWGNTSTTKKAYVDAGFRAYSASGPDGFVDWAEHHDPGVVLSAIGAQCGKTWWAEGSWTCIKNTIWFRSRSSEVESRFLFYATSDPGIWPKRGAAQPFISQGDAQALRLRLPSLSVQRRVVGVLSAIDDLTENNRRRIGILEKMARLIYREWFVDFRFPGHEDVGLVESALGPLPEGWEAVNLFHLADVAFGFSFKSNRFTDAGPFPVVRIRDIPKNSTSTFTDEAPGDRYSIVDGDILIGMDGDFHMCRWANGLAYLNQRVTRIRTDGPLSQYHLFLGLERPIRHFNDSIIGTTVAHLGKRHLEEIVIAVPTEPVLQAAEALFQPMFELEINLRKQGRALAEARDLLLPRLVSGELDVSDLNLDREPVA